jgi:hypothetical protein
MLSSLNPFAGSPPPQNSRPSNSQSSDSDQQSQASQSSGQTGQTGGSGSSSTPSNQPVSGAAQSQTTNHSYRSEETPTGNSRFGLSGSQDAPEDSLAYDRSVAEKALSDLALSSLFDSDHGSSKILDLFAGNSEAPVSDKAAAEEAYSEF